jgi:hypothetical protein
MSRAERPPACCEWCASSAACFWAANRLTFTLWVIAARGLPELRISRGPQRTTSLSSHTGQYSQLNSSRGHVPSRTLTSPAS